MMNTMELKLKRKLLFGGFIPLLQLVGRLAFYPAQNVGSPLVCEEGPHGPALSNETVAEKANLNLSHAEMP